MNFDKIDKEFDERYSKAKESFRGNLSAQDRAFVLSFLHSKLEEAYREGQDTERKIIDKMMIRFEKTNRERKDKIAGWYWLRSQIRTDKLTTSGN